MPVMRVSPPADGPRSRWRLLRKSLPTQDTPARAVSPPPFGPSSDNFRLGPAGSQVAFVDFWTQLARPTTDRVGVQQREAPAFIYFPDFQFRLFLEDPN